MARVKARTGKKTALAVRRRDVAALDGYGVVLGDLVALIESARRAAARSVNAVMTATYFLIGRAIVEQEQKGAARATYGEELLERLGADLAARFGRGFSPVNLGTMRLFYLAYEAEISQKVFRRKFVHPIPSVLQGAA
jgi:hypothetical protein